MRCVDTYGSGITDINALVAQPGSGKLYGAGSSPPGKFVDINPVTGKAAVKGSYGMGDNNKLQAGLALSP